MLKKYDLTKIQWECVHFVNDASFPKIELPGLYYFSLGLESSDSKKELIKKIAGAIKFPAEHGENWDALNDSLSDLGWIPAKGYILLVKNVKRLLSLEPEVIGQLIQIWLSCAEKWSKEKKSFHLLIDIS